MPIGIAIPAPNYAASLFQRRTESKGPPAMRKPTQQEANLGVKGAAQCRTFNESDEFLLYPARASLKKVESSCFVAQRNAVTTIDGVIAALAMLGTQLIIEDQHTVAA